MPIYEGFSAFIPSGVLLGVKKQLRYNSIPISERKFAGFVLAFALALGMALGFLAATATQLSPILAFAAAFASFVFIVYAALKLRSESRGKFVESVLPDALQLIASNMKSGLTTERALFVAGRPEFGPLQIELRNASKKISSGEKVEGALAGISERISSTTLTKTMWLISEGIHSGGQISDLLFQIAKDLKNEQAIADEIKANISIYVMLILFASIFGSPFLLGASTTIVQVISKQVATTPTAPSSAVSQSGVGIAQTFTTGQKSIPTVDFISLFSTVTIIVSSFFASLTIGIINSGKEISGLKYVVPVTLCALLVYFAIKGVMQGLFGTIL